MSYRSFVLHTPATRHTRPHRGASAARRYSTSLNDLETAVEVNREVGGQGGVRFWVVSLGGSGSVARGSTHRVTLQLVPKTPGGEAPLIRDVER